MRLEIEEKNKKIHEPIKRLNFRIDKWQVPAFVDEGFIECNNNDIYLIMSGLVILVGFFQVRLSNTRKLVYRICFYHVDF